jgi:hypothetical protein
VPALPHLTPRSLPSNPAPSGHLGRPVRFFRRMLHESCSPSPPCVAAALRGCRRKPKQRRGVQRCCDGDRFCLERSATNQPPGTREARCTSLASTASAAPRTVPRNRRSNASYPRHRSGADLRSDCPHCSKPLPRIRSDQARHRPARNPSDRRRRRCQSCAWRCHRHEPSGCKRLGCRYRCTGDIARAMDIARSIRNRWE